MKHEDEAEKNGLSISDYTDHESDDYDSKKISVESDQDFKKHLHKMNSENGSMVDFSGYNLQNEDDKMAKQAEEVKKDDEWKIKMLAEAEQVRNENH